MGLLGRYRWDGREGAVFHLLPLIKSPMGGSSQPRRPWVAFQMAAGGEVWDLHLGFEQSVLSCLLTAGC